MQRIAITGNIGTGKSEVGKVLLERGEKVLDIDDLTATLYHQDRWQNLIQEHFGLAVFTPDGQIDRRKLAKKVFADEKERWWLEKVIWPPLKEELQLWFFKQEKKQRERVFVLIPLLFEAGWEKEFDQIWLVRAKKEDILTRLQIRDRLNHDEILTRLETQIDDQRKTNFVDLIIYNFSDLDTLRQLVIQQIKKTKKA